MSKMEQRAVPRDIHDVLDEFEGGEWLAARTLAMTSDAANAQVRPGVPSPVFFHFPAIKYMFCLSITTEFEGPAAISAPMVSSLGPANYRRAISSGTGNRRRVTCLRN